MKALKKTLKKSLQKTLRKYRKNHIYKIIKRLNGNFLRKESQKIVTTTCGKILK